MLFVIREPEIFGLAVSFYFNPRMTPSCDALIVPVSSFIDAYGRGDLPPSLL